MNVEDLGYAKTRELVGTLVGGGVEVVAVGAGSRSTPLALAFVDDGHAKVFSHVDERSAAFFALGAARATGGPAAVVTTSGTAAANVLPAVAEARAAGVPLIALTADRPPELHDAGAMQTIEQTRLLSPSRWAADLHSYDEDAPASRTGALAVAAALGPPAGPVHVNVRFREPLVPSREVRGMSVAPGVARSPSVRQPSPTQVEAVATEFASRPRGLIYAGHLEGSSPSLPGAIAGLSAALGYPVIAEATSRLRGHLDDGLPVDAAESLIRADGFEGGHSPAAILRIGRAPLTRRMQEWLHASGALQVVISDDVPWPDPGGTVTEVLAGDPALVCAALRGAANGSVEDAWAGDWLEASAAARAALDEHLDGSPMFEGTVARAVAPARTDDAILYVATSLPIRALETFTPSGAPLDAYANRGASGIDGTVSGALGALAATGGPTVCLAGDLAFLHDLGALLTVARHRLPLVTVVIDNGGGGIFDFLPQAEGIEPERFDDLFTTSHQVDLMRAAELYDVNFATARNAGALEKSLKWAFTEGGPWVIRAAVRRDDSVEAHRGAWAAVEKSLVKT